MAKANNLTENEFEIVDALRKSGKKVEEIVKIIGMGRSTVERLIRADSFQEYRDAQREVMAQHLVKYNKKVPHDSIYYKRVMEIKEAKESKSNSMKNRYIQGPSGIMAGSKPEKGVSPDGSYKVEIEKSPSVSKKNILSRLDKIIASEQRIGNYLKIVADNLERLAIAWEKEPVPTDIKKNLVDKIFH